MHPVAILPMVSDSRFTNVPGSAHRIQGGTRIGVERRRCRGALGRW